MTSRNIRIIGVGWLLLTALGSLKKQNDRFGDLNSLLKTQYKPGLSTVSRK
jgi:hypothetical protein